MSTHDVDYVDLPINDEERYNLISKNIDTDTLEDRGDCIRVPFNADEQIGRAGKSKPCCANLEELKISFLNWMRENKPELLACKVEKYLHDLGHVILWTPPYCPKLQPIKLFWAGGKNCVALKHVYKTTMRDVIKELREGWYGDVNVYDESCSSFKHLIDCCD